MTLFPRRDPCIINEIRDKFHLASQHTAARHTTARHTVFTRLQAKLRSTWAKQDVRDGVIGGVGGVFATVFLIWWAWVVSGWTGDRLEK